MCVGSQKKKKTLGFETEWQVRMHGAFTIPFRHAWSRLNRSKLPSQNLDPSQRGWLIVHHETTNLADQTREEELTLTTKARKGGIVVET